MESLQSFYPILFSKDPENVTVLKDLVPFWKSNKDVWFSHMPIHKWTCEQVAYTEDLHLSMLLHYDQIYRHPNPKILAKNKPLAFRFATSVALQMLHNGQFDTCEEWAKVFVLLTLRHNASLPLKELALKKLLHLVETDSTPLLLRFLNATVWDIHQWKHKNGYTPEVACDPVALHTFESILETPKHSLGSVDPSISHTLRSAFETTFRDIAEKRVAISISGGVDSMVAAHVAKQVCDTMGKELLLLHICYGNRDCCEDEVNLLRAYSQTLGVPLYVRWITELKRCRTSGIRTVYEEVTRRIRFSFYSWFDCPVVLGHNQDDCFENVFRNLAQTIHFDNLFGMSKQSQEQGVTILRPMLDIPKEQIVAFADSMGIPHLYDSTPSWSQRGQMRDRLLPGIQSFDPNILKGLSHFVKRTVFLEEQWKQSFDAWMKDVMVTDMCVALPRNAFFESNRHQISFWVQLWKTLGFSDRPSNRSFQNCIEFLNRGVAKRCNLNSHWVAGFSANEVNLCRN